MSNDERLHEQLLRVVQNLPGDYKPWGEVDRDDPNAPGRGADCSGLCRHYLVLQDVGEQRISLDWGVCINPRSHRYGLLTFEHQGCPAFEYDKEEGARLDAEWQEQRGDLLKRRAERGLRSPERTKE
jgi:hypothetical protein